MKKFVIMFLCAGLLFSILSSTACSSGGSSASTTSTTVNSSLPVFTAAQLSTYDGKNGNPAYVAVDGVVYDVTDVPQWSKAVHNGHVAGTDLSSVMKDSPHGSAVLNGLTVVGTFSG